MLFDESTFGRNNLKISSKYNHPTSNHFGIHNVYVIVYYNNMFVFLSTCSNMQNYLAMFNYFFFCNIERTTYYVLRFTKRNIEHLNTLLFMRINLEIS